MCSIAGNRIFLETLQRSECPAELQPLNAQGDSGSSGAAVRIKLQRVRHSYEPPAELLLQPPGSGGQELAPDGSPAAHQIDAWLAVRRASRRPGDPSASAASGALLLEGNELGGAAASCT